MFGADALKEPRTRCARACGPPHVSRRELSSAWHRGAARPARAYYSLRPVSQTVGRLFEPRVPGSLLALRHALPHHAARPASEPLSRCLTRVPASQTGTLPPQSDQDSREEQHAAYLGGQWVDASRGGGSVARGTSAGGGDNLRQWLSPRSMAKKL
eukprot:3189060-Rhodomonas_salina.3